MFRKYILLVLAPLLWLAPRPLRVPRPLPVPGRTACRGPPQRAGHLSNTAQRREKAEGQARR